MSTAIKTVYRSSTPPNKDLLRDTYEIDKLNALCAGVDLLSQLVAIGDQNNPKLRAQLLQLSSALAKLECSVSKPGMPSQCQKETISKQFKPILPTPKGKLVFIIERLKQASINQQPIPVADNAGTDIVNATHCNNEVEAGWTGTKSASHYLDKIDCTKQKPSPSENPPLSQQLLPSSQSPASFSQTSILSSQPPPSSELSLSSQPQQLSQPLLSSQTLPSSSQLLPSLQSPPSTESAQLLPHAQYLEKTQMYSSSHSGSLGQPEKFIVKFTSTKSKPKSLSLLSPTIPPPPPPPPSPISDVSDFSFQQQTLSHCPSVPLKPLFWKKVPRKSAIFGSNLGVGSIWTQVSESSLTDKKLFFELFAKKETSPYRSTAQTASNKSGFASRRPVMLLGGRRSQAVSIMLHSLPCEVAQLSEAVKRGDPTVVNRETLQSLHDLQATTEELDLINCHLKLPDTGPLDKPEMFLHTMSEIPQFNEHLVCLLYSQTLPESSGSIVTELSVYNRLSRDLRHSTKLLQILGMVLTLGNVMNFGNQARGAASGYQLEILPKLRDVKTADKSSNLLRFLVNWYLRQTSKLQGTLDLEFPLPDPADIMTLTKLDFDSLRTRTSEYNSKLDCFKTALKKVLKSSPENLLYPFKTRMETHLQQFECDTQQLSSHIKRCEKDFQALVQYYCMTPLPGQSSVDPAYFFGLWNLFVIQFQEDWKQGKIEMAKEKLREEELQRRSEAVVKPLSSLGLKSKLARYFKEM